MSRASLIAGRLFHPARHVHAPGTRLPQGGLHVLRPDASRHQQRARPSATSRARRQGKAVPVPPNRARRPGVEQHDVGLFARARRPPAPERARIVVAPGSTGTAWMIRSGRSRAGRAPPSPRWPPGPAGPVQLHAVETDLLRHPAISSAEASPNTPIVSGRGPEPPGAGDRAPRPQSRHEPASRRRRQPARARGEHEAERPGPQVAGQQHVLQRGSARRS